LTGSAATTANLTGSNTSPNRVTRLGNFSANGFTLTDGIGLAVNGALSGGTGVTIDANGTLAIPGAISGSAINLSASSIGITGAVADGGNGRTNLVATSGAINETGTLIAGTLTGSAATTADLTGSNTSPNQIATLGNFSANGFTLTDGRALSLAGTLTSPNIALLAPTSQISFGDGATIVTGGTARPAGPITASLEPANGGPGTFVQAAGFSQIGSSRIVGIDGGPATLQISVTGNARFDQPLGLRANQTWLIVNLTNGSATGDVFVNALDLSYTQPGSSVLFGSINGNTTGGAAALGTIQPAIDSHYTFNGCIIEAAVCRPNTLSLYTSVLGSLYPFLPGSPKPPPALSGLVLVAQPVLPAPTGQLTDPDVVPPNISFLDY
jgi:fibronectin-binding autotransporter adhesin